MPAQPLAAPARPFRRGRVVLAIATVVVLAAGTRAALAIRRPSLTPERKAVAA